MARKRHGGLGKGLDALIPQARYITPRPQNTENRQEEEKVSADRGPESHSTKIEMTEKKEREGSAVKADTGNDNRVEINSAEINTEEANTEEANTEEINTAEENTAKIKTEEVNTEEVNTEEVKTEEDGTAAETEEEAAEQRKVHRAGTDGSVPSGHAEDVTMLRLSQVDPNRSQPRKKFEEESLDELADSIRQFGVLQPILVQKKGSRYEIIAGERRWRASRKAGLKEIPAIVRKYTDQESLELSLIENIQRQDLNPIEEARAFQRLLNEFGLRQEDLAARVSKSRTAITNSVRLLRLDARVQDMVVQEQISMGHARALIPVEIPEEQFLIAQQIAEKHMNVRDVEKLIKKRMSDASSRKSAKNKKNAQRDPALELAYKAIEERLRQSLGTRATVRSVGDGTGRVEIDFYSHDDLEKIVDLLT